MTDRIYGIDRAEGLAGVFGYLTSGSFQPRSSWLCDVKLTLILILKDYYLDRKWWTPEEKDSESMFTFYLDVRAGLRLKLVRCTITLLILFSNRLCSMH